MRAITLKYDYVRLLVLDLIGRAGVLRRQEIFAEMRERVTEGFSITVSPEMLKELLEELAEEELLRVSRIDAQHPQQFLLTVSGCNEVNQATAQVNALVENLLRNRRRFPSRVSTASTR